MGTANTQDILHMPIKIISPASKCCVTDIYTPVNDFHLYDGYVYLGNQGKHKCGLIVLHAIWMNMVCDFCENMFKDKGL